jgi:predicted HAD superfamily hydrolase
MGNIDSRIQDTVKSLLNDYVSSKSYFENIGYTITGPLYFGYICWIIQNVNEKKISDVFFLSRDGWNPYLLYKKFGKLLNLKLPSSRYFYASRRAMLIPSIENLTIDSTELRFLISSWWEDLKVKEFLFRLRIELSREEAMELIKRTGFPSLDYRVKKSDYERLTKLFLEASNLIIKRGKHEKKLLLEYTRNQGLLRSKYPAIVDIGWGGSMQKSIYKLLQETKGAEAKLDGFYVGTNNRMKSVRDLGIGAYGFILNKYPEELSLYTIWQTTEILEFMFSAKHPTVLFFKKNPKIEPQFSIFNNEKLYRKYAAITQRAAFKFIDDLIKKIGTQSLEEYIASGDIDSGFYISNLLHMVLNPTLEDARNFHFIRHMPGLGETAQGDHIVEYCASYNPKMLCYRFEHAYWENGFLKTLTKIQKFILFFACKKYRERKKLRKAIRRLLRRNHPTWDL